MLELYISGIDENNGKYVITAGLAATMQSLGYDTCVYKPIQTGAIVKDGFAQSPDLAYVKSIDPYVKTYFSYLFQKDDLPLLASEAENVIIKPETIYNDYKSFEALDCIITDGGCGLSAPVNDDYLEQHIVKMLELPILFVVSGEASLNNVISVINQAFMFGLRIRGVVINDVTNNINKKLPKLIEKYTPAKVLGIMPSLGNKKKINPNDLITNVLDGIDLESVFDVKIAKLQM